MPHSKKTTVQQTNDRNMTERKANASAKSKEVQPNAQADPHLLLPQPTTRIMRFFADIWKKIKSIFKKKKSKSTIEIYEGAKAIIKKGINKEEILEKARNTEDENERKGILKTISEFENAKSIVEVIEEQTEISNDTQIKKKRKRLYEFYELEAELGSLEEKLTLLNFQKSQIIKATYPDTSSIDRRVEFLSNLLDKNKSDDKIELSRISISAFDKSFQQLEKLLTEKSTLRRHTTRENVKQKQEEIYKNQIKQKLSTLENLINQNKLAEAKTLINLLSSSIKPNLQKELARLTKSKEKYKEKELQNFRRQEEELLKRQAEQAKILKEQEDKRLTELKLKKEQEAILKKAEEEKLNAKANRLKALLDKKANWRDFQKVLQENGITAFYHFTDQSNLKSIKENGGLFSWFYCDLNNIVIPMPGGSMGSRQNDTTNGKKDFVRVAFNKEHPMLFIAEKDGRISNAIWLDIDIEVAYFENTEFSDKNAAAFSSYKPKIGKEVSDLENVRFDILKKAQRVKHYKLSDDEKPFNQAEVLVKTWIPLEHITNINDFA